MKKLHFYVLIAIFASIFFISCSKDELKGNEGAKTSAASSAESKTSDDNKNRLIFSTKDLDGNTVTDEIFEKYDVTLVNIWGTFCGPCKAELPDLEAAYQVYAKKNCNVIALTSDLYEGDKDTLELAKEIWKDTGCTFKALESVDAFLPIFESIAGVPTSFFVDKNGKIIDGLVHTGRLSKEGFEKLFETALKTVGSK